MIDIPLIVKIGVIFVGLSVGMLTMHLLRVSQSVSAGCLAIAESEAGPVTTEQLSVVGKEN